jgi:hypothetical protein
MRVLNLLTGETLPISKYNGGLGMLGIRILSYLFYNYRKAIPRDELIRELDLKSVDNFYCALRSISEKLTPDLIVWPVSPRGNQFMFNWRDYHLINK